jgi:response regulator of citrate/malate metabolism
MEITNERYMELIKTEMLYRMTKNALKNGVPYNYILVMLGEIATPLAKVAVYNTPAEPTGNREEAPRKPVSDVAPTTEAPKPKATVKRRIPQETIDKIVELTNECKTTREIAEEVGVSVPTVSKYQREVMDCEE